MIFYSSTRKGDNSSGHEPPEGAGATGNAGKGQRRQMAAQKVKVGVSH